MSSPENPSANALVFGSTGLVGSHLLTELLDSGHYSEIIAFNRRSSPAIPENIKEVIVDFGNVESLSSYFTPSSHIYICLGTTIRKAGSIDKMDFIDRRLPLMIAELASKQGVQRVSIVSSIGANANSRNYYLRIKGEMEEGISKIPFQRTVIARPSILLGKRNEFRFGEYIGKGFTKVLNPLMLGGLRKYRGIHASTVAKAMVKALHEGTGLTIIESEILKQIASY